MAKRMLVGKISKIKKMGDDHGGGLYLYEITFTLAANSKRIDELKLDTNCIIEYEDQKEQLSWPRKNHL